MTRKRLHSHVRLVGLVLVSLPALMACERNDKASSTQTSAASSQPTTGGTMGATPEARNVTTAAASMGTSPSMQAGTEMPMSKPIVTWKGVGLSTPETVLHDSAADVYLVSNIEGQPGQADNKAFISKLAPDGTVATLKWIEGGKGKVTLNAPKGMTIAGDNLYVADLDTVRIFDLKTGAPVADVKIPGASFLNGAATAADGRVLMSDTGVKATATGMDPTGTDAIYAIDKDKKVSTIAKSKDLGGPNGIAIGPDGKVWVCTMTSGEIYSLDMKGKRADIEKMPKGMLDGIVALGDELLVTSWDANAVYRGKPGGPMKVAIEGVKSPAGMGYDKKRARALIPLFQENEVRAYDLK